VCTKTTVTTEQMPTASTVTSTGKGGAVMVSTGKGHRRLAGADSADMLPLPLLAGKALIAKAAGAVVGAKVFAGGAMVAHSLPQTDVQCNDVSARRRCCNLLAPEPSWISHGCVVELQCLCFLDASRGHT
jgi:hypothetical protein